MSPIAPPSTGCGHCPSQALPPITLSLRVGGCTFPEDPAQTCASVLPLWSAAVDPCVLTVRAVRPRNEHVRLFDAKALNARMVRGPDGEHLVLDRDGEVIRFDIVEGTTASGPIALHFDVADSWRVEAQLSAIRALRGPPRPDQRHGRWARRLLALQAVDVRDAGASLREIAEILLGSGDWPGNGEHRKSVVRRLLSTGSEMIRSGPRAILNSI